MKILKKILSKLLVLFNMIPYETRKTIFIHLLKKLAESSENKLDDKAINYIIKRI